MFRGLIYLLHLFALNRWNQYFPKVNVFICIFSLQTSGQSIHKVGSLTPPSSPKMAPKGGHRRILSDVTHSAVFGVPVSKSTQLLQAAAAEASLNKSKWAEWISFSDLRINCPFMALRRPIKQSIQMIDQSVQFENNRSIQSLNSSVRSFA